MTTIQEDCDHDWDPVDVTPLGATRQQLIDYCTICGKRGRSYEDDLPEADVTPLPPSDTSG